MFALLFTLTGGDFAPVPKLIDHWHTPPPIMNYVRTMMNNATDGAMFMKPETGHEDGCIMGVCRERSTAPGNDGILHAPMHKPVSRL